MTITDKQARDRVRGIGSSDAAAIFGLSPWTTPYEVWMHKTGRAAPFEGNQATLRGDLLERAILDMVSVEIGEKIVSPSSPFVKGVLRANVDGMVGRFAKGSTIVECKSSTVKDGWGKPGTDEIPVHVMIQVQVQMYCAESNDAIVAKLGHNLWPDLYPIPYDPDLAETVARTCEEFWNTYVATDEAPPIENANESLVKALGAIERAKGATVAVDPSFIREYAEAKAAEKEVEARVSLAKAKLLAAMGDAQVGEAPGWRATLSWCAGRKGFDTKRFKEDHPVLHDAYQTQGAGYSTLRIKEIEE